MSARMVSRWMSNIDPNCPHYGTHMGHRIGPVMAPLHGHACIAGPGCNLNRGQMELARSTKSKTRLKMMLTVSTNKQHNNNNTQIHTNCCTTHALIHNGASWKRIRSARPDEDCNRRLRQRFGPRCSILALSTTYAV